MRKYRRLLLFHPHRGAMRLLLPLALLVPSLAVAQQFTSNAYVGGRVDPGGLVTIYRGNPVNKNLLTYINKSFLTLKIDGKYYSNNTNADLIGPNATIQPVDVPLAAGDQLLHIKDTLRTIWKEHGFDIEQDVFPVQFSNSGVIVISVKIINHSSSTLNTQAQFLLDNMNSDPDSSNDNPFLITRYGYIRGWQDSPPSPVPSFYLAFEHSPTDSVLGTVGIGYENDSFPPRPLGLVQPVAPSSIEFGDWPTQVQFTWGPPATGIWRNTYTDEAALLMGNQIMASPYLAGQSDSVTEVFRTAYGVPEWCYDHGNMFGFALYPHHLYWDPATQTYSPNPFQVEAFLFTIGNNGSSKTTITQNISNPIRVTSPQPAISVPGISPDGFGDFHWTDSAIVLPNGCAASFPVDVNFKVQAGAVDTPLFFQPWDCEIEVDCPNPDTIAPRFLNTAKGCDTVEHDTITVEDNYFYDLGLDSITYSSPDLTPAQYSVKFAPQPPFLCTKNPVKIFVTQVDTFQSGHIIFTFTDCANNVSRDTICFAAHNSIPDRTAPKFWLPSASDCHNLCTTLIVTDTNVSDTSIDRGISFISVVSGSTTNMSASGIPQAGLHLPDTASVTIQVCVTDSMHDGKIVLLVEDSTGNYSVDSVLYCTTPDVLPPIIVSSAIDPTTNSWNIHITDSQAWDRGVDSVWLDQTSNITTVPAPIPSKIGCLPKYDFVIQVVDTSQCAQATIHTRDCAGNIATPVKLAFSKGVKPVVGASKNILCSANDSIVLTASGDFTGYLWSNGDTTKNIIVRKPGSYTVTVNEGVGCSATSDPMTITSSPATPAIVPAGPISVCAPNTVALDAGAGYASYQWLMDGDTVHGMTSEKINVNASAMWSVMVTNAAGCSGTSAPVSVTINPLPPQPVITATSDTLHAPAAKSYQWYVDGVPISGGTSQTYVADTGGTFTVTITDSNGCSATSKPFSNAGSTVIAVHSVIAKESDNVTIPLSIVSAQDFPQGINRTFTAKISFNKTLLVPQAGSYVSAQIVGSDMVVTYTGQTTATTGILANLPFIAALGNDTCTTVTIDSFAWSTPNITVTTQNGNFCLDSLCKQGGTRLIDPDGKAAMAHPVPNPAYSSIEIDYHLIENGHTTLTIYDVLGHEVMRVVDGTETPGDYSAMVDISSLPAGQYVCTLQTPTIVKSQNLQIVR